MNLLVRINLALIVVFAIGATITGLVCRAVLQANAEREIRTEAGLMMDSALAVRDYTEADRAAAARADAERQFLPQSMPFYAATENFLRVHRRRGPSTPTRKRRSTPPTCATAPPTGRLTSFSASATMPPMNEFVGERDTPMGRSLYLARPIRAQAGCLACHGLADGGAGDRRSARYGSDNGFGWQAGDVIGAQVVSVPIARAESAASGAFRAFLVALTTVFVALLLVVNLVLYFARRAPGAAHGADRRPVERRRHECGGVSRRAGGRDRRARPRLQPHAQEPRQGAEAAGERA